MTEKSIAKRNIVEEVALKVAKMEKAGEVVFPADYVPQNALKSAWLKLQSTLDRNKQPVLKSCTQSSIMLALLDTVVQGLDPGKDQVYYIAYGKQLTASRSYFGSMALAMRVNPEIKAIDAMPIWQGDKWNVRIKDGLTIVEDHQPGENFKDDTKIISAYCMAKDKDGKVLYGDFMTMDQIKKAWAKSAMKPVTDTGNLKSGSVHEQFTEKMATKTVVNRLCKKIISMSTDSTLVASVQRQELSYAEGDAEDIIEQHQLTEPIDIDIEEPQDEPEREPGEDDIDETTCTKCGTVCSGDWCPDCKITIQAQGRLL